MELRAGFSPQQQQQQQICSKQEKIYIIIGLFSSSRISWVNHIFSSRLFRLQTHSFFLFFLSNPYACQNGWKIPPLLDFYPLLYTHDVSQKKQYVNNVPTVYIHLTRIYHNEHMKWVYLYRNKKKLRNRTYGITQHRRQHCHRHHSTAASR